MSTRFLRWMALSFSFSSASNFITIRRFASSFSSDRRCRKCSIFKRAINSSICQGGGRGRLLCSSTNLFAPVGLLCLPSHNRTTSQNTIRCEAHQGNGRYSFRGPGRTTHVIGPGISRLGFRRPYRKRNAKGHNGCRSCGLTRIKVVRTHLGKIACRRAT